jgi:hypothetical protein
MLDTSNVVLNTTKEGVEGYGQIEAAKRNATKNMMNQLN